MSLETLHAAQESVALEVGVTPNDLRAMQETRIYRFLLRTSTGLEVPAVRVHCGVLDAGAKGGIRFDDDFDDIDDLVALGEELAGEMSGKTAAWNVLRNGGKGVIGFPARSPIEERAWLMGQFAHAMHGKGLGSYEKDSPAGDIGSNGLSDYYARVMRDKKDDPYWKASITGKSYDMGGLKFRPAATGWGAYIANVNARRMVTDSDDQHTVKIQGFGNVGAYQAHFTSMDPRFRVTAISDAAGTLFLPEGMMVTKEMVAEIGDNKEFKGDKMAALAEAIEDNQGVAPEYISHADNQDAIYAAPGNWFNPAALPNVVNPRTIPMLEGDPDDPDHEEFFGVVESGNGVTTAEGHQLLIKDGKVVIPDILANGAGVKGSMDELDANVAEVDSGAIRPTEEDLKRSLHQGATSVLRRASRMAEALGTTDLRRGAAGVQIVQTAVWAGGVDIDPDFKQFLVEADAA